MKDWIFLGINRYLIPIPPVIWRRLVVQSARSSALMLEFMTDDHHRARDFAVMELPRLGKAISLDWMARQLELPLSRVSHLLDELERNLVFLFRKGGESVVWAYPVTVDQTPHQVTYSSGEEGYAA